MSNLIPFTDTTRRTPAYLMRSILKCLVYGRTGGLALPLLIFIMSWSPASWAASSGVHDLMELSIEDLMKIEITSVSKKAQKISDAAAAIFVITQEDIRRSGVTSIPEALRMSCAGL